MTNKLINTINAINTTATVEEIAAALIDAGLSVTQIDDIEEAFEELAIAIDINDLYEAMDDLEKVKDRRDRLTRKGYDWKKVEIFMEDRKTEKEACRQIDKGAFALTLEDVEALDEIGIEDIEITVEYDGTVYALFYAL